MDQRSLLLLPSKGTEKKEQWNIRYN